MRRTAYVIDGKNKDFTGLYDVAENIQVILSGYEPEEDIPSKIWDGLGDFDPEQDVIVPVGRVVANMWLGIWLSTRRIWWPVLKLAYYSEGSYRLRPLEREPLGVQGETNG